jgi:hypothetical protein
VEDRRREKEDSEMLEEWEKYREIGEGFLKEQ